MEFDKKWLVILISFLSQAQCRPQNSENSAASTQELQKNKLEDKEQTNNLKTIEAKTHEIIEKIAEVNKKHALEPKNPKSNLSQITSSEPRSQGNPNLHQETARGDFKFATNPFSNPIFDFLERENTKNAQNFDVPSPTTYDIINRQSLDIIPSQGYEISSTNHNAEITKEDIIPGQQIKRKIVHQQTILVPNPNYGMSSQLGYPYFAPQPNIYGFPRPNLEPTIGDKKHLSSLERQTISNVRNIISNSQNQVYPNFYSPYIQVPGNAEGQSINSYIVPLKNAEGQDLLGTYQAGGSQSPSTYGFIQPPKTTVSQDREKARQNWNWPGADYFPIFIKDPFLQMYNAVTTMIEYGPNAGNQNPCASASKKPGQKLKIENLIREGKTNEGDTKISVELDGKNRSPQISINADNRNGTYLDIENIDIGAYGDNSLKFTLNLKKEEPEVKKDIGTGRTTWDQIKVSGKSNSLVLNAPSNSSSSRVSSKFSSFQKDLRPITITKNQLPGKPSTSTILSPPIRDPTAQTQEYGDESEEEKSEELISNDNNKKLFSRDNTGSGVFIHKLKVRKGGVAIAGPGGIATAGSGGTAIVGPGGVAYTQPDSLAIAGSGTKVVAVDPHINLGDLANSTSLLNRTRIDTAFPPSRFGKVVAVGPVVYYNKG